MKFFSKKKNIKNSVDLDKENLPKHIAIIMDGNGRWAKQRNLPRIAGHRQGVEAIRGIIEKSSEIGIGYLTLYAFSTENWNRPKDEVNGLMDLLVNYLRSEVKELHKNNVRIQTIGDIKRLPESAKKEIDSARELTKDNKGLTVNIALNYGSRDELVNGIRKIAEEYKSGLIDSLDDINQEKIDSSLYTFNTPDPDLMIRTSGEIRLSNFLLWQLAYSELWFTEKYWPDFKPNDFVDAIKEYQDRNRRYGGV